MSGVYTKKIDEFKKTVTSTTDATITTKNAKQFSNLFAAFNTNVKRIAAEAMKDEKRDFKKIKQSILTLNIINQNIKKSLVNAEFKANNATAANQYKNFHETLQRLLIHRKAVEGMADDNLKVMILDILDKISKLPDPKSLPNDDAKAKAIKEHIVPLLEHATRDELVAELIDACAKLEKDDDQDQDKDNEEEEEEITKFTFVPEVQDIDDVVRERRQQKKFSMRSHTNRGVLGDQDTAKKALTSTGLFSALESKTKTLFTDYTAKAKYSSAYTSEYSDDEVAQNIQDKEEIFKVKGLKYTKDSKAKSFIITLDVSAIKTVNMLKVECKADAKDAITEVSLTQHSNLNRAKVLVTEELAEIARGLHANFVEISSYRKTDNSVNVDNVIQGAINALYANLLPIFDQDTLQALKKSNSEQAKLILNIHSAASNTADPKRCSNALIVFEDAKNSLTNPFKRVRDNRGGRIQ